MQGLFQIYGRGLTYLFVTLVSLWILLMIVVPSVRMIERAFTYEDRGSDQAMIEVNLNRLYAEKFGLEQKLKQADKPVNPAAALDPFAPSMAATPALSMSETERAEINTRIEKLQQEISVLEASEDTSSGEAGMQASYSLKNFTNMDGVHFEIFWKTLLYSLMVTLMTFVLCYPVAFVAATTGNRKRLTLILMGLMIPYAINELLRIFSWVMILDKNGILNSLLDVLGFIDMDAGEGFRYVSSNFAVFVVMVYAYVLFMVFPLYNIIDTLDKNQIEAARDLGASSWRIHTRVVIPHAKPGIAVGSIMTFMLSAGSVAAPEIVGRGLHPDWFSQVIYRRFFEADSWNSGSAYSLALLVACMIFILINMKIFKVSIRDIAR